MSPGQMEQVCSLELLPGGAEQEGETPGSLDSASVYRHALSCTCVGLLHPAFQTALQSGWFCLLQSRVPSGGGGVDALRGPAKVHPVGSSPHCSEGPGPAPGCLPTVSCRLRHSTDLLLTSKEGGKQQCQGLTMFLWCCFECFPCLSAVSCVSSFLFFPSTPPLSAPTPPCCHILCPSGDSSGQPPEKVTQTIVPPIGTVLSREKQAGLA